LNLPVMSEKEKVTRELGNSNTREMQYPAIPRITRNIPVTFLELGMESAILL
jgi:hypothetical protein